MVYKVLGDWYISLFGHSLINFILSSRSHFWIGVLMLLGTLCDVIGQFWLQIELHIYYAGAPSPWYCDMVCFPDFYNSVPDCWDYAGIVFIKVKRVSHFIRAVQVYCSLI